MKRIRFVRDWNGLCYTAVPVLNDQEQYIGSVTEGDFLRHLLVCQTTDLKVQEGYRLGSIVRRDFALRYK